MQLRRETSNPYNAWTGLLLAHFGYHMPKSVQCRRDLPDLPISHNNCRLCIPFSQRIDLNLKIQRFGIRRIEANYCIWYCSNSYWDWVLFWLFSQVEMDLPSWALSHEIRPLSPLCLPLFTAPETLQKLSRALFPFGGLSLGHGAQASLANSRNLCQLSEEKHLKSPWHTTLKYMPACVQLNVL